jgi:hypothetical protein
MDAKNHILFACCHSPQTMVILNADDGKIITSLPIGNGVDGAAPPSAQGQGGQNGRGGRWLPDSFTILVVGH